MSDNEAAQLPWFPAFTTYFGYFVLIFIGWIRDSIDKYNGLLQPKPGYAPLIASFKGFYIRRLYHRIRDAWNRPICSAPGAWIDLMLRKEDPETKTLILTNETKKCLNLGSYNYLGNIVFQSLGFGDAKNNPALEDVVEAMTTYGVSTCSYGHHLGTTAVHKKLEDVVTNFIGKSESDAWIFGMGFGVNATVIPAIVGKGSLVVSDSMNHASIVFGARTSGAKVKIFNHNDHVDLERVLKKAIIAGQPRTGLPWEKILIIVEGVYSMEGEICSLKRIVEVKNRFPGVQLYLDEAHSIGAIGDTGRGACEYNGVSPDEVDIMMGTFTKSFGAVGGYIVASHDVIAHLRRSCAGTIYSAGLSPVACQQVCSAMHIIGHTELGKERIKQLKENAVFFRNEVKKCGVQYLGEPESPVVPIMLGDPAKISAFSREALRRGLAVVVVGYPATAILTSRVRICLSSSHSRKDLEFAMEKLKEVFEVLHIRYKSHTVG